MDKTESRYAEISREMIVHNNWITPILEGKPFWAKPPLSSWCINISYKIFGLNDFAAKFPSMILCLLSIYFLFMLAKTLKNKDFALITSLITLTTGIFYVLTGGVMTDPSLLFTITMAMSSFLLFIKTSKKMWAYLFFVGLGLSALAKGPIGIVFILTPIFIWALIFKELKNIFKNMPIITGFFVFLLIAIPWYIAAEIKTPGFLKYFIIGEHFYRYTMKHWTGDMYGNPSPCPLGTIWVYALATLIPWIFIFFKKIVSLFKNKSEFKIIMNDKYLVFFILWALFPMLLFTLSKNILATYTLPIVPPFALLAAYFLTENDGFKFDKFLRISAIIPIILFMTLITLIAVPSISTKNSQKKLVEKYLSANLNYTIYYWGEIPYSANFYSNGKVKIINEPYQLLELISKNSNFYFVMSQSDFDKRFDDSLKKSLEKIDEIGDKSVFTRK